MLSNHHSYYYRIENEKECVGTIWTSQTKEKHYDSDSGHESLALYNTILIPNQIYYVIIVDDFKFKFADSF